jgi:SAM-dependent methyltransferase
MTHPTSSPWQSHDGHVDASGDAEAKLSLWRERFAEPTTGWDFSSFEGLIETDEPPWSYDDLARAALRGATSALDIGTGGGEVLLRLADALPSDTLATEGWAPNLSVATEALAPLGIPVVPYDSVSDERMPFEDERIDVVLDRHESYLTSEVFRILKPGGRFVTQQVDGRDFEETHALFGGTPAFSHVRLQNLRAEAEDAGFVVDDAREWAGTTRFVDVAAFVSYARMVPWELPDDFSVDRYAEQLLAMRDEDLVFTRRLFVLVCRRPAR